jgi:hypothetical protein
MAVGGQRMTQAIFAIRATNDDGLCTLVCSGTAVRRLRRRQLRHH